jgi:acetyl-CoA carboxylase carboxyltransferase component
MLDKSIGADLVFAWPTAQVTIVGAATAASVIFAKEIKEAEDPKKAREKRIQEYQELYENPYQGAERGYIDDVIMPSDTRKIINRALDALENKTVARPWRKYSNINL